MSQDTLQGTIKDVQTGLPATSRYGETWTNPPLPSPLAQVRSEEETEKNKQSVSQGDMKITMDNGALFLIMK